MDKNQNEKTGLLFVHLIASFKSSAMQQLGKVPNPVSGKLERDLPQASMTIDMLDMINTKCKGNLTDEENQFLQHTISELKLNYVDEIGREDSSSESQDEDHSSNSQAESGVDENSEEMREDQIESDG